MVRFTTLLLTSLAASSDAWVSMNSQSINKSSPKIRDMMKSTASLSAAVAIALGTVIANPNSVSAVDFTGSYADPKHPSCTRLVAVEGDVALVSGTDGTPGCIGGEGRPWNLKGSVDGDSIFVDFSPKGGPKDLKGKWEAGKKSGIRWPDGNLWALEARPN